MKIKKIEKEKKKKRKKEKKKKKKSWNGIKNKRSDKTELEDMRKKNHNRKL